MLISKYKSVYKIYLNCANIGKLKYPTGHLNVLTLKSEQLKAAGSRSVARVQAPMLKLSLLKDQTGHFRNM